MTAPTRPTSDTARGEHPSLGLLAMIAAILCFSISSSLIRKAHAPGPTIAFWRMAVASVSWAVIHRLMVGRAVSRAEFRGALVPGVAFGLNITLFFTAITHTSIANVEFIGALSPLLLVPAGALFFHERVNLRALSFGLVSLAGLALVLFFGPNTGEASWYGNFLTALSMFTWCTYLLTSRHLRGTMSVVTMLTAMMPIATLTILPVVAVSGQIDDVTPRAWLYILVLVVLTGHLGHGLILVAQRSVPVGTIGIMQVAQPGIAVLWAVVLLGSSVKPVQIVGMGLVIVGLVLVTVQSQRAVRTP